MGSFACLARAEHEVEGLSDESELRDGGTEGGAEASDVWSPPEVHDMGSAFDSLNLSAVPRGVPARIEDILNGRHPHVDAAAATPGAEAAPILAHESCAGLRWPV